ncbi:hypothetical protein FHW83_002103 [Duganella sp. SG902]|uniref:hypothetical protein n=1 Tax=Duganella sp. SG902 TaxID=2587016 RepID=UPI00159D7540|nr:hypothetical protein [Duganella sp. SG902]NVM76308.1 hypothetical protein [Duganella sp. SG902]
MLKYALVMLCLLPTTVLAWDDTNALAVTCSYTHYSSFDHEEATIAWGPERKGEKAHVQKFMRAKSEENTQVIGERDTGDCIFPSGLQVRMKVDVGTAGPGMCGGDPAATMSLWINRRKVATEWFAGYCKEEKEPAVSFKILGAKHLRVEKCHATWKKDDIPELSVCIDLPDLKRYPIDELEYPSAGSKAPVAGEVVIRYGKNEVCREVKNALHKEFTVFNYGADAPGKLQWFEWQDNEVRVAKDFHGYQVGIFDLNNDGRLDRVYAQNYSTNYMIGNHLLVQYGQSNTKLIVPDNPLERAVALPCHIANQNASLNGCAGFGERSPDYDLAIHGTGAKDQAVFRERYTNLTPFRFRGATYLAVTEGLIGKDGYAGVLKIRPDGSAEKTCLLEKIRFHM